MQRATLCYPIREDIVYLAEKKLGTGVGYLNGYGGRLEEGEGFVEAARRELTEEAAVTCDKKDLKLVGDIDFYIGERHVFNCAVFFLTAWQGELSETIEMGEP